MRRGSLSGFKHVAIGSKRIERRAVIQHSVNLIKYAHITNICEACETDENATFIAELLLRFEKKFYKLNANHKISIVLIATNIDI